MNKVCSKKIFLNDGNVGLKMNYGKTGMKQFGNPRIEINRRALERNPQCYFISDYVEETE